MRLPIPSPALPDFLIGFLHRIGFSETGRELAPVVFVILTISAWPIALAIRYIRSPSVRMFLSAIVGLATMVGVYGAEMTGVFAAVIVSFYGPCRYRITGPGTTTFLVLVTLGLIHYDAILSGTATDRMSHTGTLMMMVAKISMFAFHVDDGFKKKKGEQLSVHAHIAAQRSQTAILSPSLIDYLVYLFEFQGGLVGPLFTYAEFMDFIHVRGDFSTMSSVPLVIPSLKSAGRAFAILGTYLYLSKQWWFGANCLFTTYFRSISFVQQLVLAPFVVAGTRLAYYSVWALSEVACTLSGLSFVPPHRFTRGRNVNLRLFELSPNFNSVTNNWNIRISDLWLKQCIYQRVENVPSIIRPIVPSRKGLANFTTKLTSALWHGWYPGYAISFLSLGLCNWSETLLRQKVHPRLPGWLLKNPLSTVFAWMHTWWSVNIFFAPFVVLTWDKTVSFYSMIFWCGHLYHFALIALCLLLPTPRTLKAE